MQKRRPEAVKSSQEQSCQSCRDENEKCGGHSERIGRTVRRDCDRSEKCPRGNEKPQNSAKVGSRHPSHDDGKKLADEYRYRSDKENHGSDCSAWGRYLVPYKEKSNRAESIQHKKNDHDKLQMARDTKECKSHSGKMKSMIHASGREAPNADR